MDRLHPSKTNHERMSLHDLIAFGVMAHMCFEGVYKKAYRLFMGELKLFPKVRCNRAVENLNRHEGLLLKCLKLFKLEGELIVDSKPIETKKLIRFGRHRKMGKSKLIKEGEVVGSNPLKGVLLRLEGTCLAYGRYIGLL